MSAHMVVAAYVVGGFLIASVYAVGMLRGRDDRYHRLGFMIPFSVAAVAIFAQMAVGDSLARWVYNNQPVKFAAIELVPQTTSDVPETLFGHLNSNGTVSGGIPIPGSGLDPVGPEDRNQHRGAGPQHRAGQRRAHDRRGQHRAPVVGHHGRLRHPALPAGRLVLGLLDLPSAHAAAADGSCDSPPGPGSPR